MLTPNQQRKRYLLLKAKETPEQKTIRLQKIKEYSRRKYWNATPLEIENRQSYHRKKYRRFKCNLEARMKKKINSKMLYKNKNVEEKPKRKYTRRKPVTLELKPEHAEVETILPDDDVDLDWQDIFITRLGLQDDPEQQPEIKLEHIFEGAKHQERNIACLATDGDGVVEYPLNEPGIKEEHVGDIPLDQCEPVEDIEIGPEVKQEFICNQFNTENIQTTSLNPEFGIKQETEIKLEILNETNETIKLECTSNAPAKIYPEVKQQIKSSTKFSKLPQLRSKHEALRYVKLLEAFALHMENSYFIGMTGRLQEILKESI